MKKQDIELGVTYLFMGSESPKRKHLAGQPFTVVTIDKVYRKVSYRHKKRLMKVTRFFNEDGIGARAEELGELPIDRFYTCPHCKDVAKYGDLHFDGQDDIQALCPSCGAEVHIATPF